MLTKTVNNVTYTWTKNSTVPRIHKKGVLTPEAFCSAVKAKRLEIVKFYKHARDKGLSYNDDPNGRYVKEKVIEIRLFYSRQFNNPYWRDKIGDGEAKFYFAWGKDGIRFGLITV